MSQSQTSRMMLFSSQDAKVCLAEDASYPELQAQLRMYCIHRRIEQRHGERAQKEAVLKVLQMR